MSTKSFSIGILVLVGFTLISGFGSLGVNPTDSFGINVMGTWMFLGILGYAFFTRENKRYWFLPGIAVIFSLAWAAGTGMFFSLRDVWYVPTLFNYIKDVTIILMPVIMFTTILVSFVMPKSWREKVLKSA